VTYVDTSALIAFSDASDSFHSLFRRLFSSPPPGVFTTTHVVAEGHAWFLRRFDVSRGLRFVAMVEDMTFMSIQAVGVDELAGGVAMLRRFSDQDLTLVDAVGLHLMSARSVDGCWSTDRHMGLLGTRLAIHT
jgi:predicted nucleic acid-binding protein